VLDGDTLPASRAHSIGETLWLVEEAAMPENFRGR
jgi:6-phosphogluconolactonase